jgi:hypothetical protein
VVGAAGAAGTAVLAVAVAAVLAVAVAAAGTAVRARRAVALSCATPSTAAPEGSVRNRLATDLSVDGPPR